MGSESSAIREPDQIQTERSQHFQTKFSSPLENQRE